MSQIKHKKSPDKHVHPGDLIVNLALDGQVNLRFFYNVPWRGDEAVAIAISKGVVDLAYTRPAQLFYGDWLCFSCEK